ncbi:Glutathione S-transferase [Gracilaria domingensis]|nr:Glutathione S-transferase [Gracilaria domingensis]
MTERPVSHKGKMLFAKAGPDGKSLGDCPFTQKANLALRFHKVDFDVTCVYLANKPDWFLELNEAGTAPVFQNGDDVLTDSEAIVKLSDELGTGDTKLNRPQEPLWTECEQAVNKVFKSFVVLVKNKDDATEEEARNALSEAVGEVEAVLVKSNGKYLLGDAVCTLDFNFAPKLHHIWVAGRHFKEYDVFSVSPRLGEYMDRIRALEAWKPTICEDEVILWGWSKFFK